MRKCIEIVNQRIKDFFKIDGDYKAVKISLLAVLAVLLLAYNKVFSVNIANPDGIVEGFYYYANANWASAGCGRWFIRYYNALHHNIVSPVLVLIEYLVFTWLANFVIIKTLNIKNKVTIVLTTVLFCLTPTVISHLSYTCTAAPYALSSLLAALFVYLIFNKGCWYFILASLCLAISLGCYQSYIGLSAALVLIKIIIDIINHEESNEIIKKAIRCILAAILGGILYLAFYKLDSWLFKLIPEDRVAAFSVGELLRCLPSKTLEMFSLFFKNFNDAVLLRRYAYLLFGLICLFMIVYESIKLLKKKEICRVLILLICILLLPCVLNIIGILIPYNIVHVLMIQQCWIIFPFVLSFLENDTKQFFKPMRLITFGVICFLSWTYVLSANATFSCYEISHRYNYSQIEMALNRVYNLDNYQKDKTEIVMIGFPDESNLRDANSIYSYAINLNKNVAFWTDFYGSTNCREEYFRNMFGIEAGYVDDSIYNYVVISKEFKEMPVWPAKGSVDMIGDFAVIKFTDNPLYPY